MAGGIEATDIAKWNPAKSCWSSLGSGVNNYVYNIQIRSNHVFVGGIFSRAGGKPSNLFGIWQGPTGKHAPAWSKIPDVTFSEDDSTQLELYQFVADNEHNLHGLDFKAKVIYSRPRENSKDLQIRLKKVIMGPSSRYEYATFTPAKDARGVYKVIFTVTDACGASASDTIRVIVKPVNDPPVIGALPEITFNEDDSLLFPISNWFEYVTDVENDDSGLFFRIFSSEKVKALRRDKSFLFTAAPNWYGNTRLKVRVKDRRQLADSTWLVAHVKSVNDPPVIQGLPDSLSFQNTAAAELNLWEFVDDLETPDSLLQCTFAASRNRLNIQFDPKTGNLKLTAPSFSGRNHLYITVKDWRNIAARDTIIIHITPASLAKSNEQLPTEFVLQQNYPNPFNPTTMIRFGLPHDTNVQLEIYNLAGHRVATLLNAQKAAGYHDVLWDASGLSSGVYFYRLTAGQFRAMKKLMLMR